MFTLAQFLTDSPVPSLPDPPALEHYLLESPWAVVIALVLGGLIALIVLNRRGKVALGSRILIVTVVLAGLVYLLSAFVETTREKLAGLTRDLVHATAAADTGRLDPMLSDRVGFTCALPIPSIPTDKQTILDGVRTYLGNQYPLESHTLGPVQAVVDGPASARTQLRVWVRVNRQQAVYDASIGSWWRIDWRKDAGEQWHVTNLTLVQLDGLGGGKP